MRLENSRKVRLGTIIWFDLAKFRFVNANTVTKCSELFLCKVCENYLYVISQRDLALVRDDWICLNACCCDLKL